MGIIKDTEIVLFVLGVIGYGAVSLNAGTLNPFNWGASLRQQKVEKMERARISEEAQEIYDKTLRKAQWYDGKIGLSWSDKAKLAQDLGIEEVFNEGDDIEFGQNWPPPNFRLYVQRGRTAPNEAYDISKQKVLEYLAK